jgi:putative acetyltransferase
MSPGGPNLVPDPAATPREPRALTASLIEIRPERPADHDSIRALVAAAFASAAFPSGGEELLVERIRASPEYVPEMALVAVVDSASGPEIAGHVMISGATLRGSDGDRRIAMLSPLSVAPSHQGMGIGGALIRAACAIADERGEPFVVLEGSPQYYGRHGFEPAANLGIELPIPAWAPSEAAQVIRLRSFDPGDTSVRGTVIYPVAFDELD